MVRSRDVIFVLAALQLKYVYLLVYLLYFVCVCKYISLIRVVETNITLLIMVDRGRQDTAVAILPD